MRQKFEVEWWLHTDWLLIYSISIALIIRSVKHSNEIWVSRNALDPNVKNLSPNSYFLSQIWAGWLCRETNPNPKSFNPNLYFLVEFKSGGPVGSNFTKPVDYCTLINYSVSMASIIRSVKHSYKIRVSLKLTRTRKIPTRIRIFQVEFESGCRVRSRNRWWKD